MATAALPGLARAQVRPLRLIVPYPPGGPLDIVARSLAEKVKDSLGVVIVDNKPGAGGNIGADIIAKAAPDGLTIGIAATATNAVNPWLYSKMPFNAATDFAPITQMVRVPNVLVMNAAAAERLKIATLADLIRYAKANPAKLNYGSGGNGSAGSANIVTTLTMSCRPAPVGRKPGRASSVEAEVRREVKARIAMWDAAGLAPTDQLMASAGWTRSTLERASRSAGSGCTAAQSRRSPRLAGRRLRLT